MIFLPCDIVDDRPPDGSLNVTKIIMNDDKNESFEGVQ